jgi:hypothetical protein
MTPPKKLKYKKYYSTISTYYAHYETVKGKHIHAQKKPLQNEEAF